MTPANWILPLPLLVPSKTLVLKITPFLVCESVTGEFARPPLTLMTKPSPSKNEVLPPRVALVTVTVGEAAATPDPPRKSTERITGAHRPDLPKKLPLISRICSRPAFCLYLQIG